MNGPGGTNPAALSYGTGTGTGTGTTGAGYMYCPGGAPMPCGGGTIPYGGWRKFRELGYIL